MGCVVCEEFAIFSKNARLLNWYCTLRLKNGAYPESLQLNGSLAHHDDDDEEEDGDCVDRGGGVVRQLRVLLQQEEVERRRLAHTT